MFMLLAAALMVVTGCKKDDNNANGEKMTFSAGIDNGGVKTEINGLDMSWNQGDAVIINGKTFIADKGGASTTLSGEKTYQEGGLYKAYFPASIWDNGTLTLPATQTYNGNNLSGVNPMYAQSENTSLTFSNLCSMVKLTLNASGGNVKTVTEIRVSADQPLSGEFEVAEGSMGYKAVLKSKTDNAGVTLICGTGVSLSENNVFYVALPEENYTNLKFKVMASDGTVATIEKTSATLAANNLYELVREPAFEMPLAPTTVTVTAGCSGFIYNVGGSVTLPSGIHTCEFGIVYSETNAQPTVADTKIVAGIATFSGSKSFTADLTGLTIGTTYHVRAYAEIEGVTYSATVKDIVGGDSPQPLPSTWTSNGGKSPKQFTVADPTPDNPNSGDETKVRFSQGNLQYIGNAAAPYWKFADHQFDFIGNGQDDSFASDVDRDLFGWGTSGWDNGNCFYQPYCTSNSTSSPYTYSVGYGYGPTDGNSYKFNLTGDYANADWGVYNVISNGGNVAGSWRTLTKNQWAYLIDTRKDGSGKLLYGEGKVGGCTLGLIILPDDWSCPAGVTDVTRGAFSWSNVYSYSQWAQLEAAGAVFLPAAGCRNGTSVHDVGSGGYYWSSSYSESNNAFRLYFNSSSVYPGYGNDRYFGFSVRLVTEN